MNQNVEFTKEDLINIAKLFIIVDDIKGICRIYNFHKLEIKIQSMIDNYREQEPICHRCGHGVTTNE